MTFEEFQKADSETLMKEAKACFDQSEGGSWDRKAAKLLEAQMYVQELDRRDELEERKHIRKIERRDFRLELVVIVLISVEIALGFAGIWLAVKQGKDDDVQMESQTAVLKGLSKSMGTTLATMQSVNERMAISINRTVQGQIDYSADPRRDSISITNNTNLQVTVWGYQLQSQAPVFLDNPIPILRGSKVVIPSPKLFSRTPSHSHGDYSLMILLKDEIGTELATDGLSISFAPDGAVTGSGSSNPIVREQKWSASVPAK